LKDKIWDELILKFFTFPRDCDMEIMRKKAKQTMGPCFKKFKLKLSKDFILACKEPRWDLGEHRSQRDFWESFREHRLFEQFKAVSRKNKANSEKAEDHHNLGSRGYLHKLDEFEEDIAKVKGERQTRTWDP
jgi:hypothetical protein